MTEQTKIDIVKSHRAIDDRLGKFEKSVKDQFTEIRDIIKPMSETYAIVIRLGVWVKWLFAFVLLVISVLLGVKKLLE